MRPGKLSRRPKVACSDGNDFGLKPVRRHCQAVRAQRLDIQVDRFLYIIQRFRFGAALRYATWQAGAFYHPKAILTWVDQYLASLWHVLGL